MKKIWITTISLLVVLVFVFVACVPFFPRGPRPGHIPGPKHVPGPKHLPGPKPPLPPLP